MKFTKITSFVLAALMAVTAAVSISAADINTPGGTGSTPVNLTSTDDGTLEGNPAATAMSVTIPTALPMAMGQDGTVTTATDCKIINNSYGAVRVSKVTINSSNNWHLTAFGDKSTLADAKVDSNKIGFAMSIGGGTKVTTKNGDDRTQPLINSPITGCYMTGVGDENGKSVAITYDAIVTPLSNALNNVTVASVVFIIEWDKA